MVGVPHGLDQLGPQQQAIQQGLTADVEIPIAQPQAFVHRRVRLVDVERRGLRLAENLDGASLDFDLTSRQFGVLGARQPPGHLAGDLENELVAHRPRNGSRRRRLHLVNHDLSQAVAVAQVDEDEPAVVAPAMDPARDPDLTPGVSRAQLAASDVAVGRSKAECGFRRGCWQVGLTHRRIVAERGTNLWCGCGGSCRWRIAAHSGPQIAALKVEAPDDCLGPSQLVRIARVGVHEDVVLLPKLVARRPYLPVGNVALDRLAHGVWTQRGVGLGVSAA